MAGRRCCSHPRYSRSHPASISLPSIKEGRERGHKDLEPWYFRSHHSCRRYCPSRHPPTSPAFVRGQGEFPITGFFYKDEVNAFTLECTLRVCSIENSSRSRLRCQQSRHCGRKAEFENPESENTANGLYFRPALPPTKPVIL